MRTAMPNMQYEITENFQVVPLNFDEGTFRIRNSTLLLLSIPSQLQPCFAWTSRLTLSMNYRRLQPTRPEFHETENDIGFTRPKVRETEREIGLTRPKMK